MIESSRYILFVTPSVSLIQNWIVPLMKHLTEYEPIIIHMASLQDSVPSDKYKQTTYDVSSYSVDKIKQLIKEKNPVLCVFFNFRSLLEQLILKTCKDMSFHCLYLEHGILNYDNEHFKKIGEVPNKSLTIKRQIVMLLKIFRYNLTSSSPVKNMSTTYKIIKKNEFKRAPFDSYFVYGERCYNYIKKIYPDVSLSSNAKLVGYPLFDTEMIVDTDTMSKSGILYVHQPFIKDGLTNISYEEEKSYILKLADQYSKDYGDFTLLLHPREDLKKYSSLYTGTSIEIIQSPNNYKLFQDKSLVLGHYSTALLYSLYFKNKTLVVDYPNVFIQPIFEGIFPHVGLDGYVYDDCNVEINDNAEYLLGPNNSYLNIASEIRDLISNL